LKLRTCFSVISSTLFYDGQRLVFDCAAVTGALLIWMTRLGPSLLGAAKVVQPDARTA
jgi:hypothetical protein